MIYLLNLLITLIPTPLFIMVYIKNNANPKIKNVTLFNYTNRLIPIFNKPASSCCNTWSSAATVIFYNKRQHFSYSILLNFMLQLVLLLKIFPMRNIGFCLLLLFNTSLFGQVNLVPNPSFEDTVACPTTANQINKAVGWHASRESPDYFNVCDFITGNTSVPSNFTGYQYARTGVAYAGFIAFYYPFPNGREYFSCQLNSPLQIGHTYNISFYISWSAGVSDLIACNKIGANFSLINHSLPNNPQPILNYSHIYSDSIVRDSLGWFNIHGSFIADSNYSYFTIGNFFDDLNTDTIMPGFPSADAYYYVDDISVIEDTTTSMWELQVKNRIKIYPNPFVDVLFIESSNNMLSSIELYDATNKLILKSIIELQARSKLNVSKLKSGLYFLKINFINNSSIFHKIIKL